MAIIIIIDNQFYVKPGAVFKAAYYQVVKKKQICIDYILKEKHYPDPGLVYGWTSNKPKAKTHGFIPEFKLQFIQEFVWQFLSII